MKKALIAVAFVCVIALCGPVQADSLTAEAQPAAQHLVQLTVDPLGSVIMLGSHGRPIINSDFVQRSAVCTDCGGACAPTWRTVEVVIEAVNPVAAGYGVSNMVNTNYTIDDITYSTQGALGVGGQVLITITGDVVDCGAWFSLWFDMCDVEPAGWSDPCPPPSGPFWLEDFENDCVSDCLANSYVGINGPWSVTPTGANGAWTNVWYVSCAENGMAPGQCGIGCGSDETLHVGTTPAFVGDFGALYLEAGGGMCNTYKRAQSPTIDCTGKSNISIDFDYIEWGWFEQDHAELWYYDGTSWSMLDIIAKTPPAGCFPQGTWAHLSTTLPASADNNPNVRIGFLWENVDPGGGAEDPSFAVNDIVLSTP